jgi:NADH-quinone oxidoreductase subunit C
MSFEEICNYLSENNFVFETKVQKLMPQLIINQKDLLSISAFLKHEKLLFFDQLSSITGIDNGPEVGTMEVIYNFNSIINEHQLCIKVILERSTENLPSIPSVSSIWKTADWHERETYDLLGINFENHPDLRRILLPADWVGFPLRKDYEEQEQYNGLKVKHKDSK